MKLNESNPSQMKQKRNETLLNLIQTKQKSYAQATVKKKRKQPNSKETLRGKKKNCFEIAKQQEQKMSLELIECIAEANTIDGFKWRLVRWMGGGRSCRVTHHQEELPCVGDVVPRSLLVYPCISYERKN